MIRRIILLLLILATINQNTHATKYFSIEALEGASFLDQALLDYKEGLKNHGVNLPTEFEQLRLYRSTKPAEQNELLEIAHIINPRWVKLLEHYFEAKTNL